MVWGATHMTKGRILYLLKRDWTRQYVARLFMTRVPNGICLFQKDNARPHTAVHTRNALENVRILDWPARSHYLSPIQRVGDEMGRHMIVQASSQQSSLSSLCPRHTSIPYSISCHTRCSIGPSTSAMASMMRTWGSSIVGGKGGRYTCCFTKPQRKKSQGVKSAELGGQGKHFKSSRPADPIRLLGNRVFSSFLTPVPVVEEAITVACLGMNYSWLSSRSTKHVHFEGVAYMFHITVRIFQIPYPDIVFVHFYWQMESGFATKHQWFDETFSFHSQLHLAWLCRLVSEPAICISYRGHGWNFKHFRKNLPHSLFGHF